MAKALYGLVGYPLTHSFSPKYFAEKFKQQNTNAVYQLFPTKDISSIAKVLETEPLLLGFNVTIPHKETILTLLDKLDKTAKQVGAVNCVEIKNNLLTGYNTDVIGFEKSLKPLLNRAHKKALILGTGGASKAIAYALKQLNIDYSFVSRNKAKNVYSYIDIEKSIIDDHQLIINTTPLGMHPNTEECPDIPYHLLSKKHLLYDTIYNPEKTSFLQLGEQYGTAIKNGQEMLELQANASWEIWNS